MREEDDRHPDPHGRRATLDDQIDALQLDIRQGDERLGSCLGRLREGWNAKKKYVALGGVAALAAAWWLMPHRVLKDKVATAGQRLRRQSPELLARWGLSLLMPIALGALSAKDGDLSSPPSEKAVALKRFIKQVLGMFMPLILKPRAHGGD